VLACYTCPLAKASFQAVEPLSLLQLHLISELAAIASCESSIPSECVHGKNLLNGQEDEEHPHNSLAH
jgi:hypothetical protein